MSLRPRLTFVLLVAAIALLAQRPWAGGADATSSTVGPGLTLSFATGADAPAVDARAARLVALAVPAGGTPSPFLPPGPFTATWTGLLASPRHIKEAYRFTAEGAGHLTVTVNGQPVLDVTGDLAAHPSELVTLHKAKNKLVVTYRPPPTGDARVRLLWARDDHPDAFDPVPPTAFTHDLSDAALVQHGSVRLGREVLVSSRCAACHTGVTGTVPELAQDAPDLTEARSRLRPAWMAYWITNPRALRPTADMPRVFTDRPATTQPTVDGRAADLAAYLSANAPPELPPPPPDAATLARGARVFGGLGCVACHVAPGLDDTDPSLGRVPLRYVAAKYRPDGLAAFLRAPEAHFAWVKMPNFHLSDADVSAVSAWLLSRCKPDALPPVQAGDAGRGKALFASAGCMSCHVRGSPPSAVDLSHADWAKGCAANGAGGGMDYGLTSDQVAGLRSFAATAWQPTLTREGPADFAARQMVAVRCNACHKIDDHDSVWSNLDADVSAIEADLPPRPADDPEPTGDQTPPPLTWAGEKLRPTWSAAFIAGRVAYKPRPWIAARMPSFASRANGLAAGLAAEHGCPSTDEPTLPADPRLATIGRNLTGQTAFGCVKCHAVAAQAAIAPFEAFAPNFAHVTDRLRHDYYRRWMRNPQVYLPGTKMPSFGNADGKTPYKDVLGGDAAAEYGAIWDYLLAGDKVVPAP